MRNIIGKSNGLLLIEHSKNTCVVAEYVTKKILNPEITDELIETIIQSSLSHDIGKANSETQKMYRGEIKTSINKYRHNEIVWAVAVKYTKLNKMVTDAMYWHHGISNKINSYHADDVLNTIEDHEIATMVGLFRNLLGDGFILDEPKEDNPKSPLYYDKSNIQKNYKNIFVRTILILSDRIASKITENNINITISPENVSHYVDPIFNDYMNSAHNNITFDSILENSDLDVNRLKKQIEIVRSCDLTTSINASGGYGKTIIGILKSLTNNKKTLFIVPRNNVAESLYVSILNDLKLLKLDEIISVELFLAGDVEKSTNPKCTGFTSDIIISNIDNFLAPTRQDNIADRLSLIIYGNVIFDEYHELILQNNALHPAFIEFMKVRHILTNSETLLLSATPTIPNRKYGWDTLERKTKILPEKYKHYNAIHNKKYSIKCAYGLKLFKEFNNDSNLIITNSIKKTQQHKSELQDSMIYHSNFSESDGREKLNYLLTTFGKYRKEKNPNKSVVSSLLTQASLDITFKNLAESVQSPYSSIQRVFRCDRFDDFNDKDQSMIYHFKLPEEDEYQKNENFTNSIFYPPKLTKKWFDELCKLNNTEMTLDDYLNLFNSHMIKHEEEINKFLDDKYLRLYSKLENIYPRRFKKMIPNDGNRNITLTKNNYRVNNNSVFYIVEEYNNPNNYVGPFSHEIIISIGEDFNEPDYYEQEYIKKIKLIQNSKDDRFDYSKIVNMRKNINSDIIHKWGVRSKTPIIRFDVVYHKTYGIIKPSDLKSFLK